MERNASTGPASKEPAANGEPFVRARFGDMDVLVTATLAAEVVATKHKRVAA